MTNTFLSVDNLPGWHNSQVSHNKTISTVALSTVLSTKKDFETSCTVCLPTRYKKKNPISLTFMSKAEAILETRNVSTLSASMYCMAALAAALA